MKQSYHTDLQIQFKFGLLNRKNCENIPKSTLHSWKNRDFSKHIGCESGFSPLDQCVRQGLLLITFQE